MEPEYAGLDEINRPGPSLNLLAGGVKHLQYMYHDGNINENMNSQFEATVPA